MKYLLLKLSPGVLSLTPVKSGRRAVFGAPCSFELPPDLRGGAAFSNLPALAEFVKQCRRDARLPGKAIVFCLEDENVVSKEYQHPPCKPRDLVALSKLEAESVLSDDVDDYLIRNCEYGEVNERSGKLKSSLFAVRSGLITEICRMFAVHGMKVVKIVPPIAGLLYATKHLADCRDGTVAVLDLDFEKTRLLVLHNGFPLFQRTFEGIYEEIIGLIMRGQSFPFREAEAIARTFGQPTGLPAEVLRPVTDLLDASASEVIRNIRMVLSSDRLELNRIYLCGPMSVLPGYAEFWNSLSLDVPLENIGAHVAADHMPRTSPQANRSGLKPAAYFSFWGLLRAKKAENFDFLTLTRVRRNRTAVHVAALTALTLFAFAIMALQPALYVLKSRQIALDQTTLANPSFAKIQSLTDRRDSLASQAAAAETERSALPYGKSKTEDCMKKLYSQIASGGGTITTCSLNNTSGSIAVTFTVSDYDHFLEVKHSVEAGNSFGIAIPFTASAQTNKGFLCNVMLSVKGFVPFGGTEKGGAAK